MQSVRFGSEADMCGAKWLSALPPKADVCGAKGDVRFVPKADIQFIGCATGNFHVPLRISGRGR
jgi:hypothetical protein